MKSKYQNSLLIVLILILVFFFSFFLVQIPIFDLLTYSLLISFALLSYNKPVLALYITLLLPVLGEFSRFDFLGRSIILSDLLLPIFEIFALLSFKNLRLSNPLGKLIIIVAAFLLSASISTILSFTSLPLTEVLKGSLYLIRLIIYFGLIPITYLILKNSAPTNSYLKVFLISATLVAITGFIQLKFLPNLESLAETAGYDPHINRLTGSWLDPNFIGGYFAFIACITLSLFVYTKKISEKVLYSALSAFFLISIFLTYSRSTYVALIIGVLSLGILKARQTLLIIIIIGLVGISISDRAQERTQELIISITSVTGETYQNPDPTARLRIENWQQTLTLISQKPLLGHGYNNLAYTKVSEGMVENAEIHSASGSDSSLLTIFATTGIIGLLTYLIFLINILKTTFLKWLNKSSSITTQALSLGLLSAMMALLGHSFFVNSLLFPQIILPLFSFLGFYYFSLNKKNA